MSRRRQALKAFYAAMFSGLGSGLVMIVAGALFGAWRGGVPVYGPAFGRGVSGRLMLGRVTVDQRNQ
jgi:hypothetical protein